MHVERSNFNENVHFIQFIWFDMIVPIFRAYISHNESV